MLKVMREKFKSLSFMLWAVIAAFIILIFVGWGVGTGRIGSQKQTEALARVGTAEISLDDFNRAWRRRVDRLPRELPDEQRVQVRRMLLDELINRQIMLEKAKGLGLQATRDEVQQVIGQMPIFNRGGSFVGKQEYLQILENQKYHPQEFESMMASDITINKLRELLDSSVIVPEDAIHRQYIKENDKAQIEYVVFDTAKLAADVRVSPEEALDYYKKHKEEFAYGVRKAKFVLFRPDAFLDKVRVKDQEVYDYYYDQSGGKYEEKRRVSDIFFKLPKEMDEEKYKAVEDKAKKVYEEIKAGADFAAKAKEYSENPASAARGGDLGLVTREQIPQLWDAASSLEEGEVSEPIPTDDGFHIIKVTQIIPETPIEKVQNIILNVLKNQKARQLASDAASDAALRYAQGKDIDAAGNEYGLEVEETPFFKKEDTTLPDISGDAAPLIRAVFSLKDKGDIAQNPVTLGPGYAVVQYADSKGPVQPEFQEAKDKVEALLKQQKAELLASREADRFYDTLLKEKMDFAKTASLLKVEPQVSPEFLKGQPVQGLGDIKAVSEGAFQMDVGQVSRPVGYPQGKLIYVLKSKFHFDPEAYRKEKASVEVELQNTESRNLFSSFLANTRAEMQKKNQIVLNADLIAKNVER
jgi:peptidyl-prolyl cis-trans isomerase D